MGGVSWGGKGVVWCLKKKRHHKTEMDARYFVAATLICILTSWWVAGGRFLCRKDEKGGSQIKLMLINRKASKEASKRNVIRFL